jgi:hypothetical protein
MFKGEYMKKFFSLLLISLLVTTAAFAQLIIDNQSDYTIDLYFKTVKGFYDNPDRELFYAHEKREFPHTVRFVYGKSLEIESLQKTSAYNDVVEMKFKAKDVLGARMHTIDIGKILDIQRQCHQGKQPVVVTITATATGFNVSYSCALKETEEGFLIID